MSVLTVEGLTVRYGSRAVLDGVSLQVEEGEVYALLGRNGSGKTSLLRCLLGEQRPLRGRATLLGFDSWSARARALREVGVVPEDPQAPPALDALALSRFCSRLYPRWDDAGLRERLRRFGVPERTPFGALSRGQKAQVALALALAPSPRLLLLDDPTLGLDPAARRDVFEELIGELADRGTSVFLTTHDLAGVEGIAERVGVLHGGRLVLDETVEALKQRFRRISFPAGVADAEARERLASLVPRRVAATGWGVEAIVERYAESAVSMAGARVDALSLEEIFLAATGATAPAQATGVAS